MIRIYGIKNCSTVKKSRSWLDDQHIPYEFNDFKQSPPSIEQLTKWKDAIGLDRLLNKRSTTWRALPEDAKENINDQSALELMQSHPSLIKRPILETSQQITCGFQADIWTTLLI
jgi:arsenate reductase